MLRFLGLYLMSSVNMFGATGNHPTYEGNIILFTRLTLYSFGTVVERDTASAIISFFFPGEEFSTIWT
jgi:hypothetical protein